MNDNMVSRVTRLVSASVNALIDAAEGISPQMVMKEGIREVEALIDEVKIALGKQSVKKLQLQQRIKALSTEHERLGEQIVIALEKEREELAKVAIARQIDIEKEALEQKSNIADVQNSIKKLEGYIDALDAKKRQMLQELQALETTTQSAQQQNSVDANIDRLDKLFNRLSGFDEQRLLQEEAKLSELTTLANEHEIAKRLEAIKSKKS